ncbi:MAG: hypothetical protein JW904_14845 [Spirochaetales bacterium]|nr:hypothetical protein [Spirochaetales bacterium]
MPSKKKPATKKTSAKKAPVNKTIISSAPAKKAGANKTIIAASPVRKAAKKPVKKTAKKPVKKAVKKALVKKSVSKKTVKKPVKKASAKKPAAKKATKKATPKKPAKKARAKKTVTAKSVVKKKIVKKTVISKKLPAVKKSDIPKDVVELLKAFADDDFKIEKNTVEAAKKLVKGRHVELLAGMDWQSRESAAAKKVFQTKLKFEQKHIDALEKGLLKGMGGFVKDAKKPLPGPFYDWPQDPPTVLDEMLEMKDAFLCEHLKCLFYCCCCCSSCCDCCDWPWWRRCRCKYCCHRCVIEVGPTASNTYPHVHRIKFTGAGVSVSGSTATVTITAAGGVTMAQVNGAIAEHAANTSNQHAFGTTAGTYSEGNHTHSGYASSTHNHSGVYEPVINPKNSAFNKAFGTGSTDVATGDHTHSGYASSTHTHTFGTTSGTYAEGDHDHDSSYYTETEVDGMFVADTGNAGVDDQGSQTPDTRFYTKKTINDRFLDDIGAVEGNPVKQFLYTQEAVLKLFSPKFIYGSIKNPPLLDPAVAGRVRITFTNENARRLKIMDSVTAVSGLAQEICIQGYARSVTSLMEISISNVSLSSNAAKDTYWLDFDVAALTGTAPDYNPAGLTDPWDNAVCYITYLIQN